MRVSTFSPPFGLGTFGTRATAGEIRNWRKNETIFADGDRSGSMFYIERGLVKLTMTCERGKEAIFCVCGKGEFFGEGSVAADQPVRLYNAIALTNATVIKIDRSTMMKLLGIEREPCFAFITYLLGRLASSQREAVNNLLDSSERRLSRALALFQALDQKNGVKFARLVTQQTLADMIGTTRQRVNVLMMKRSESEKKRGSRSSSKQNG